MMGCINWFIPKGGSLLIYLLSPNKYEKHNKIMLKYIQ